MAKEKQMPLRVAYFSFALIISYNRMGKKASGGAKKEFLHGAKKEFLFPAFYARIAIYYITPQLTVPAYNDFIKVLFDGDTEAMDYYMNRVALAIFSSFDIGSGNSGQTESECIIMEFKVHRPDREKDLGDTAKSALL